MLAGPAARLRSNLIDGIKHTRSDSARLRVRERIAAAIGLALVLAAAPMAAEAPFEFGLIGDYPYFPREGPGVPHLIDDLARSDLRFVVHLGDLHNPRGETRCSDALYRSRFEMIEGTGHPFLLTPGDNDWADCRDESRSTFEHLEALRRIFFSDPTRPNGGGDFELQPQSAGGAFPELVENARWELGGVVFATVHLVHPATLPFMDRETEAHKARLAAAGEAWIDETFAHARERGARAVFLATQANLWFTSGLPSMMRFLSPDQLQSSTLLQPLKPRLLDQVRRFGRPVVMANGDSHYFRIDKPLHDERYEIVETFTRVEGFGSPQGHWVRVRVEPDRPEVFSFRQEIVEANVFTLVPPSERDDSGGDPGFGRLGPILLAIAAVRPWLSWLGAGVVFYWLVRGARRGVRALRSR